MCGRRCSSAVACGCLDAGPPDPDAEADCIMRRTRCCLAGRACADVGPARADRTRGQRTRNKILRFYKSFAPHRFMSKCDCVAGCAGARAAAGVVTVGGRGSGAHDARNVPTLTVNPFTLRTQHSSTNMTGRRWPPFLTTCSDASKPYMILVALAKRSRPFRIIYDRVC